MSGAEVVAAVESCGIPCAHMAWPEGCAPEPPWAVWTLDGESAFCADDVSWARKPTYRVELYERSRDTALHESIGKAIEGAFGPYRLEEAWLEDEGVPVTSWTFGGIE